MAKVNNPEPMQDADKDDALLLAVTRDGKIFFGNDRLKLDSITNKVKDRLATKSDKRVFVKADARANKYGACGRCRQRSRGRGRSAGFADRAKEEHDRRCATCGWAITAVESLIGDSIWE